DVDVVVDTADVLVVVGTVVDVVEVVGPISCTRTEPAMLAAPGPGSDAAPSMSTLPACGTQNAEASATGDGTSSTSGPAGMPVCEKLRHAVLPKHPSLPPVVCPGQKSPFASLSEAVPVTSGVRSTAIDPRSELPSAPPGMQSVDRPCELV